MPPNATDAPIGILGGTFDPIHFAHLRLALEAREALDLDHVRFIPSARPPHRGVPQTSPEHRLAMVELAIAQHAGFVADPIELNRAQQSFTIDTLTQLRGQFGDRRPICLLTGADAFVLLETWKRWQELFEYAHIVVAHRPGFPPDSWSARMATSLAKELSARTCSDFGMIRNAPSGLIVPLPITQLDISASRIRALIGAGNSAQYLIPESVLSYIERHHLYQ